MTVSIIPMIVQLIYLILVLTLVFAFVSGIRYMNWKKKKDIEMGKKLDQIIELLGKERS